MAVLVAALSLFHAAMIMATNAPPSALKTAFEPLLRWYRGPAVSQTWALFAPGVPKANLSVIVRGRDADHKTTPWYDVTRYYLDLRAQNAFAPSVAASEGVYHAAAILTAEDRVNRDSPPYVLLHRTAAHVLWLYAHSRDLRTIQIEIDETPVAEPGSRQHVQRMAALKLGWDAFPRDAALQ